MALKMLDPGQFVFEGDIVFDTAAAVDSQGLALLESSLQDNLNQWIISLSGLKQADSSALSVCLSWLRFSQKHFMRLCFTDIPCELHSLAKVCGISDLLINASCPSSET